MSRFWLAAWAFMASLAWLLPNHYLPWTAFHMDAWMALACLLAGAAVLVIRPAPFAWRGLHAVTLVLVLVPLIQWSVGLVHFATVAWMHSIYLLGLWLALLIGEQWEVHSQGQPVDALFLAIGIAAFVSVGLQLHQWLFLDVLEVWVMPDKYNRPFANFGQPNQMATLHLWALLGLAWAHLRGQVRAAVAIAGALFILFGLAMTASRTSWIGVGWIVLAAWFWRRHWPERRFPWVVTLLALWFFLTVPAIGALRELLLGGEPGDLQRLARATVSGENRPAIWSMLLDALRHSPWWGYGWGQIQWAHLAVALDHTPKFSFFAHAHNLALDLLLWMGIPLGLLVIGYLGHWLWSRLREVNSAGRAIPALLLLVTVNHALLELPLHYGYFLWPVGLLAGSLAAGSSSRSVGVIPRWAVAIGWVLAAGALTLVVRDYSRVEPEYQKLRFEWARIKTDPAQPPDVIVLGQFRDFVVAVRAEPHAGMPDAQLRALADAAHQFPSPAMFLKLARAQALNGQPEAAARSLRTLCSIVVSELCTSVRMAWVDEARNNPALKAVPWPRE